MKYTITLRTSTDWGLTNWKAALQEKPWGSGGQVEHETGCALVVKSTAFQAVLIMKMINRSQHLT